MATHFEHAQYMTKWRSGHAQSLTRCTYNSQLRNYQGKDKLAYHCTARYEMESIYTQTKVSSQGSLELGLINRKKKEREMAIFQTSGSDMYNCFDERSWA